MEEVKEEVKEVKEEVEVKDSSASEELKIDIQENKEEYKGETQEEEEEVVSEEIASAKRQNKLQGRWTIWVSKSSKKVTEGNYESSLEKIGSFETIPEFWAYVSSNLIVRYTIDPLTFKFNLKKSLYSHLKRPSELPRDHNYSIFRDDVKPMWENFPKGGCWNLRRPKKSPMIDRLWEELLFGLIGEQFEEPEVVGVVISTRSKEDVLSIWIKENSAVRFAVGEKIKSILSINTSTIEYKNHSSSIKDRSTFRNGKQYTIQNEIKNVA